MIELYTTRLCLRDHHLRDIDSHHALLSHEKTMHYMDGIKTETLEESMKNLEFAMAEIGSGRRKHVFLRAEDRETGEHIGEIGYTVEERTPLGCIASLGYFIHQRHWGKGYTPEGTKALIQYGFEKGDIVRFSCGCLKENTASEKVMIKCGMIKEGELKKGQFHDGKFKDRVIYRLNIDEYSR